MKEMYLLGCVAVALLAGAGGMMLMMLMHDVLNREEGEDDGEDEEI